MEDKTEKTTGDERIMKTSFKDCCSCGCTDYEVKYRDKHKEHFCDTCYEGLD